MDTPSLLLIRTRIRNVSCPELHSPSAVLTLIPHVPPDPFQKQTPSRNTPLSFQFGVATRPPSAALGNVTMTLKKLAAGSGYEYLTRQVAAADSTELGSTPLGDYYSAKGEAPGHWVGSGLVGLDGLAYGDTVTADHMKNLFGEGCHPVTGGPP